MCVTNTRVMPSASGPPAPTSVRQASEVFSELTPVSNTAQPLPSRTAQRLMCVSEKGSGMRSQSTPGAISRASPGAGGSPQG